GNGGRSGRGHDLGGQRRRPDFLGLGVRHHQPQASVLDHVLDSGRDICTTAQPDDGLIICGGHGNYRSVLRRRFRHHAVICRGLFRYEIRGRYYGIILLAWGLAAIPSPLLIAKIKDSTGTYTGAIYIIAAVALVSAILPFIVRPLKQEGSSDPGEPDDTEKIPEPE